MKRRTGRDGVEIQLYMHTTHIHIYTNTLMYAQIYIYLHPDS